MRSTTVIVYILASLILATGGWLMRSARADDPNGQIAPKVIRAQSFVLVDNEGKARATLAPPAEGWPGVAIAFGDSPIAPLWIAALPDGSIGIHLKGPGGNSNRQSVGLFAMEQGTGISISIDGTKSLAELVVDEKGAPRLTLRNENGEKVIAAPE